MLTSVRGSFRMLVLSVLAVLLAVAAGPGAQTPSRVDPATLVLHNGRIVTVDEGRPESRAMAVRGETIVALGSEADIKPYIGPATRVIDLKGALAIPGIVLAFGYVTGFSKTLLDPRVNPTILLIIAYAVRRLPYMVRSAAAGLQQTSEVLEEASLNLGASPAMTLRRIVLPLVAANIIAGAILCFSFAMLEVSDSIILAMKENFYPITKAILEIQQEPTHGIYVACALGVLGMVLLTISLLVAGKVLGKKMGSLFRI